MLLVIRSGDRSGRWLFLLVGQVFLGLGVIFCSLGQYSWAENDSSFQVQLGAYWRGAVAYQKNHQTPMLPASTLKVITALAALDQLGPQYRFQNVFTGEMQGSLLVSSQFMISGDPTWGHEAYGEKAHERMDRLVIELAQRGVETVQLPIQIKIDSGLSVERPAVPEQWRRSWDLECYATVITPFMNNSNCGGLRVSAQGFATWATPGVTVPVKVLKGQGKIQIIPTRDERGLITHYTVTGVNRDFAVALPVHQSEAWLEQLFLDRLAKYGIRTVERKPTPPVSAPSFLVKHFRNSGHSTQVKIDLSSRPLVEILPAFLRLSLNAVGDRLFYELGRTSGITSWIQRFLGESVALTLTDGSGLSLNNQITPELMYRIIAQAQKSPFFSDFLNALAVVGRPGTLEYRMPGLKDQVYGKSGSLDGVATLVGYLRLEQNRTEPFVIFTQFDTAVSRAQVLSRIDRMVEKMASANQAQGILVLGLH